MQIIDDTENDLKRLIEADFGPLQIGADLHTALLDWLTFRARKIPARPRQVVISSEVQAVANQYPAIQQIVRALQSGGDVSPWLSDRVRFRKKNHKADMMFNDWKISHFHLGKLWLTPQRISRTPDLLYAFVSADFAALLNVGPHGRWTEQNLLEILERTHPSGLEFELKGVTPANNFTDKERENLRANGVNAIIEVNGRTFMAPGMGIMTSGHSLRITHYAMHLKRNIEHLKEIIPRNKLPLAISRAIYSNLALPVRLGVVLNDDGLMVIDKSRSLPLYAMKPLE